MFLLLLPAGLCCNIYLHTIDVAEDVGMAESLQPQVCRADQPDLQGRRQEFLKPSQPRQLLPYLILCLPSKIKDKNSHCLSIRLSVGRQYNGYCAVRSRETPVDSLTFLLPACTDHTVLPTRPGYCSPTSNGSSRPCPWPITLTHARPLALASSPCRSGVVSFLDPIPLRC